ncbi:putative Ring finger protein [Melia azedarach]|uniref:Ring finger protein n=1 Tax=Melia azedarach TaxID=155640 RepID=A0ACC1XLS0_MELAZ|nr:putative Ring finger protein [Melia azedarach]
MGLPQSPSTPPHLYPQALQLKLYQAFIFSIPILFSIILFLLFYLFYLKRRASNLSSPPILPTSSNQAPTYIHNSTCPHIGWKGEIKNKLPTILFDEGLRTRDSQCCVCLGEFEIKEELLQVPSCKHVFHLDCIHHWLHSNTTCPLCRCSIIPLTKLCNPASTSVTPSTQDGDANANSSQDQQSISSDQPPQPQLDGGSSNVDNVCTEQSTIPIEVSSSSSNTSLSSSARLSEESNSTENEGPSD